MKKKALSFMLAALLVFGLSVVPSGIVQAKEAPGIISTITVAAPWDENITITFTNVYEVCEVNGELLAVVVTNRAGTVSASANVDLKMAGSNNIDVLKGGAAYKVDELSKEGVFTVFDKNKAGGLTIGVATDTAAFFGDKRKSYGQLKDFDVNAPEAVEEAEEAEEAEEEAEEAEEAVEEEEAMEEEPEATEEEPVDTTQTAKPTVSLVLVNGAKVDFDAYNILGNNYFKLRDLAFILNGTEKQFGVGWDGENNAISLVCGEAYEPLGDEMSVGNTEETTALLTTAKVFLDGQEIFLTAYNIGGYNYFKLRDIGAAFDFGVEWDEENNAIIIDTTTGYIEE